MFVVCHAQHGMIATALWRLALCGRQRGTRSVYLTLYNECGKVYLTPYNECGKVQLKLEGGWPGVRVASHIHKAQVVRPPGTASLCGFPEPDLGRESTALR